MQMHEPASALNTSPLHIDTGFAAAKFAPPIVYSSCKERRWVQPVLTQDASLRPRREHLFACIVIYADTAACHTLNNSPLHIDASCAKVELDPPIV